MLVMRVGEVVVGADLASVSTDGESQQLAQPRPPTEEERAKVKRELTENCVVSELLASMVLFTMVCTDMLLDTWGVEGHGSVLKASNSSGIHQGGDIHSRRTNALAVYTVITCCQIVGIFCSHQVPSLAPISSI